MTKLRTHRLSTLAPAHSREVSSPKRLSLPAVICIVSLFCAAAVTAAPAQSVLFKTLVNFNGIDGISPGPLIQASDGLFYGTTHNGGPSNNCFNGCGTVFKISPTTKAGLPTTLHSFDSYDGGNPQGVVQASDGNFYGTTSVGGEIYGGTVFRITSGGVFTIVYSFCSLFRCADGISPLALIQGTDGNFYGTTSQGGANNGSYCTNGCGTVFKITARGTLTTLYTFCSQSNCTDGAFPSAALVQGTDGSFYGVTSGGGSAQCPGHGCGTVFKITSDGSLTTLYVFCPSSCVNGALPAAALVQGADGNFYGTTVAGGNEGVGSVFVITSGGSLTTLHSFGGPDGANPEAPLVQGTDGNFYGTTNDEGANGGGTVFKITSSGTLTTLFSFDGPDGSLPVAGLLQVADGNFYGTTAAGGNLQCDNGLGCGTVFRITVVHACPSCRP